MDQKTVKKGCAIAVCLYVLLMLLYFCISGDSLYYRDRQTAMLSGSGVIGEITSDKEVTQAVSVSRGLLTGISMRTGCYDRRNSGDLRVEILTDGALLAETDIAARDIQNNAVTYLELDEPVEVPDGSVTLRVTAPKGREGNAVTIYCGDSISAARASVKVELAEEERAHVNGEALDSALCVSLHLREQIWFGQYFWYFAAGGLALLAGYCLYILDRNRKGKPLAVLNLFIAFSRYRFLIKQLVARDFKTKYKRSVLGVLWSFLNPLLTMMVQYVVFSTLFRSDIPNFALYLLSGTVCFSLFNEATNMALSSIVGNASLIMKVYVPKYIYPLTRVMSSMINFLLSLIPLFGVMLVTHTPVRLSILLLPLPVLCLFALSLGVGMFLASAMVFFRDTQFLWGVASMLLMYLTPIFYPETIIPAGLMPIYKCNPLYHILRFVRAIIMDGVTPEPKAFLLMIVACLVPLAIGVLVFKKTQDRFVLYI